MYTPHVIHDPSATKRIGSEYHSFGENCEASPRPQSSTIQYSRRITTMRRTRERKRRIGEYPRIGEIRISVQERIQERVTASELGAGTGTAMNNDLYSKELKVSTLVFI